MTVEGRSIKNTEPDASVRQIPADRHLHCCKALVCESISPRNDRKDVHSGGQPPDGVDVGRGEHGPAQVRVRRDGRVENDALGLRMREAVCASTRNKRDRRGRDRWRDDHVGVQKVHAKMHMMVAAPRLVLVFRTFRKSRLYVPLNF